MFLFVTWQMFNKRKIFRKKLNNYWNVIGVNLWENITFNNLNYVKSAYLLKYAKIVKIDVKTNAKTTKLTTTFSKQCVRK